MDNNKTTMKVFFRTDASILIGFGHVMRCLTLADQIRLYGMTVCFICRELPGNLISYIQRRGYQVFRLPYIDYALDNRPDLGHEINQTIKVLTDADTPDWLIIDQYWLDIHWEREMRSYTKRIMVIDDLANRMHDCDILLDQNLYSNMHQRYEGLVPDRCVQLLGSQYALLRHEFYLARQQARLRDGIQRIFVFFGGSDPSNETEKTILALKSKEFAHVNVDVVIGGINKNKEQIRKICADMPNFRYHCQIENMASLMLQADLAIGAGGTTSWERCLLGLPAITITIADNQKEINQYLNEVGVIRHIGEYTRVTSDDVLNEVIFLKNHSDIMKKISGSALNLMNGCTEQAIVKYLLS